MDINYIYLNHRGYSLSLKMPGRGGKNNNRSSSRKMKDAGKDNQPLSQAISLANLMVLIQNTLVDPSDQDAVNRMIGQFDVTATDWVKTHINELFDRRSKMIEYARQVDQTDQVWLPIKNNLSCSETYDWVFVDECQDLSKAQIELVKKVCFVLFFITCA